MSIFTSKKEKKLWILAFVVFITIYATLFIGQPLITFFSNQNIQAYIFVFVMIVIGTTITLHSLKTNTSKTELTIFIHKALIERFNQKNKTLKPALLAFIISIAIGIIDECIQIFLPNRVFDFYDILFNGIAVTGAIISNLFLNWVRNRKSESNIEKD